MGERLLYVNGIDATTGDYALPPMSPDTLFDYATGAAVRLPPKSYLSPGDPGDLAEVGWGVIFAEDDAQYPAIKEALAPLLGLRQAQAGAYYKEFARRNGYASGESKVDFLARFEVGFGTPDPAKVPYYLLIVGDPETIPYSFQQELDLQYAVGRIHFDTPNEYESYARSVVEAESGRIKLPRTASFFGVRNPDDPATALSADHMVGPLAQTLRQANLPGWKTHEFIGASAVRARLERLMGGDETPALLFTAGHGLGFPNGHAHQFARQGALLCQDWPGPRHAVEEAHYFAADHIADTARMAGSMAFLFACYGAGTPRQDEFAGLGNVGAALAPKAFLAGLPRRLLGHPHGGMLAVIGHVERAWGCSIKPTGQSWAFLTAFEGMLKRLMEGQPVGYAMEHLNIRYAETSPELVKMLKELEKDRKYKEHTVDRMQLADLLTTNTDAKNYIVIGDPAARLPLAEVDEEVAARAAISREGLSFGPIDTIKDIIGRGGDTDDETEEKGRGIGDTLKQVAGDLAKALGAALEDMSSLQVTTYTSDDMASVEYVGEKKLTGRGTLQMRAFTRVSLDGDTQVCVPEVDGKVDRELWSIHQEMVKEALANRTALVNAILEILK